MNKVLMIAAAVFVVSAGTARADDGSWNAGMSTQLANGTGGNDGRSNAGMSNHLPSGTGGSATSTGQHLSVVCHNGRCSTSRPRK